MATSMASEQDALWSRGPEIEAWTLGGSITLPLNPANTPQLNGAVSILLGETWNYQTWYRDSSMGSPTSNFTDGLQIDYL